MFKTIKYISTILLFTLFFASCSEKTEQPKPDKTEINILSDDYTGWAIAYSGYRKGQDPQIPIYPSQEQVAEDLRILAKNWKLIRTYGADQHAADVLEVIRKENIDMKVMLGIWMDGEPEFTEDNVKQLAFGIELANKYSDIVIAVNVGNECQVHWSDHKVPNDKLISYIKDVQSKVSVPVTTADTWDYWADLENSSKLIDAVDFLAVHIYPIWGKVDIDRGMEVTIQIYDSLKTAIPNKKIVISEAGWASFTVGDLHVPKAGDEVKQEKYFNDLMKWSEENNVTVFYFDAFDESWKGTGTEGYWGLFTEDRKAKPVMQKLYPELMTDEPTSPTYDY